MNVVKNGMIVLLILAVLLFSSIIISADATVDFIPEKPKPKDTIEVTAKISDANVNEVHVLIQECNENTGVCYTKQNFTMVEMSGNIYTTSVSLEKDDATYLQYTIHVKTSDGWIEYNKDTKVDYEKASSNNGKTDSNNDTPGFEFITLALSIMFISLILYRRKR
jgi:hypothetical protein